jgi:hypothetical protein
VAASRRYARRTQRETTWYPYDVQGDEGVVGLGHAGLLPWNLICPKATAAPPRVRAQWVSHRLPLRAVMAWRMAGWGGGVNLSECPNQRFIQAMWVSQRSPSSCEDSFHGIGMRKGYRGGACRSSKVGVPAFPLPLGRNSIPFAGLLPFSRPSSTRLSTGCDTPEQGSLGPQC